MHTLKMMLLYATCHSDKQYCVACINARLLKSGHVLHVLTSAASDGCYGTV